MKAWRWYAQGDIRLDDVPEPKAKPGWVVARVKVVQESVTGAQAALGLPTVSTERIKKIIAEKAPIQLFGHEMCAEVVELGEGVTGIQKGDRVMADSTMPCYKCELCRAGYKQWCRHRMVLGTGIPGGFAEYVALPADILTVIPDSISDNEGACLQPFTSSASHVNGANIQLGDTVVVLGQGNMGNYILQVSKLAGAGRLITVDVRDEALQLSRQLGADIAIDARQTEPVETVLQLTGGIGADVVFEAAGGSPKAGLAGSKTLFQAFDMVRPGGKVVQIAFQGAPVSLKIDALREKGIKYLMPDPPSHKVVQYAVNMVAAKRLQLSPLITHVLEGLEKVPEALELTANKAKYKLMNPAQIVVSR